MASSHSVTGNWAWWFWTSSNESMNVPPRSDRNGYKDLIPWQELVVGWLVHVRTHIGV